VTTCELSSIEADDAAQPRPMAHAGVHESAMAALGRTVKHGRVLDVGAGQGALSRRLLELGYQVDACDLVPDNFRLEEVECRRVWADCTLPFEPATFDAAMAVEVVEHVDGHRAFFAQIARVLKPGGVLVFTTPNILSIKSRLLFLWTGYPYAFPPLETGVLDPVSQHLTPVSLDRYRFLLHESGMDLIAVGADKLQRSSRLWAWLAPLIRWYARLRHGREFAGAEQNLSLQNSREALLGRTLVVVAKRR